MTSPFLSVRRNSQRGVALVLVLSCLVILSILIVAFLLSSKNALTSSKTTADGSSVKLLADTCVNIVQGQIRSATTGGETISWASQPGMIRTYNDDGNPVSAFKLFSASSMQTSGIYDPAEDAPPSNWSQMTALYTDLNSPVTAGGTNIYPIFDPDAANTGSSKNVPGCTIASNAPVSTDDAAPMPVKWLYILQDGTVAAATNSGSPTGATVTGASVTNPIVARVAFWTDDETCKVNINTAAGGAFWDTPRAEGTTERKLASFQPATNEFQRYPGHPSTVALSTIFPNLTADQIYGIVPRVMGGGSDGGTKAAGSPITPDKDRLYASVDELVFNPLRAQNDSTNLDRAMLENAKFFITANSRAPEVNLFNKPRITIWPIHADLASNSNSPYTTVTDRLIAFCSTMRNDLSIPYRYYFQRQNPDSPTNDIELPQNKRIYSYLQDITSRKVPGFGGPVNGFAAKYGADRDQILTEIFDYIRSANLHDGRLAANNVFSPSRAVGVPIFPGNPNPSTALGLVCPSYMASNDTRGFGRFPTIGKAFLWFIVTGDNTSDKGIPVDKVKVRAGLFLDPFDPSLGWSAEQGGYTFRVSGLEPFTWQDTGGTSESMGMHSGDLAVNQTAGMTILGADYGGRMGFRYTGFGRDTVNGPYPFLSTEKLMPKGGTFSFTAGTLTVDVLFNNVVIQTLSIPFSGAASVPVPEMISDVDGIDFKTFAVRLVTNATTGTYPWYSIRSQDVVRSMQCSSGDTRLIAGQRTVPGILFQKHADFDNPAEKDAHSLFGSSFSFYGASQGKLVPGVSYTTNPRHYMYDGSAQPDVPAPNGVFVGGGGNPPGSSGSIPGDWDNPIARAPDGPYINKVDEGNIQTGGDPYFDNSEKWTDASVTYFSPNRQMPSAGMFGSLSTGVKRNLPWQTLLFRPGPAGHPGLAAPADHLLLDLFQMPVVEPYAISEPFSTAGKINLNYQIVPFTYIKRDTALRAALKSQQIMAIPNSAGTTYKSDKTSPSFRYDLNLDETLKGFQARFDSKDIFRSASEICSIQLVPNGTGATYDSMGTFWNSYGLTGDNSRERPYTNLYPLLTTKSNSFQIHYRVQTLQKPKSRNSSAPTEFDESKGDLVTAEYRGSTLLERYIDPNDKTLPDFATDPHAIVDSYYRFRVLTTKQFNP